MTNKDKYRGFCQDEKNIPIFSKDWWLDTVCGENKWDVILVEKNGEIVASMPYYYIKNKYGFKIITMPKLTQTLGPYIKYPEGQKYEKRLSYEKNIMYEIIDSLPVFDFFIQNFHYNITNWQPFFWRGFKQTTRYTYVIDDLSDIDNYVQNNFSKKQKNHLKNAKARCSCYLTDNFNNFFNLNQSVFLRQDLKLPYKKEFIEKLFKNSYLKNCSNIYIAENNNADICSGVFFVYDHNSIYLIASGADPRFRHLHSKTLLVWNILKLFSSSGKKFDFEGSMIESIAEYNKSFGAVQKPYFCITKTNSKALRFLQSIRSIIK